MIYMNVVCQTASPADKRILLQSIKMQKVIGKLRLVHREPFGLFSFIAVSADSCDIRRQLCISIVKYIA